MAGREGASPPGYRRRDHHLQPVSSYKYKPHPPPSLPLSNLKSAITVFLKEEHSEGTTWLRVDEYCPSHQSPWVGTRAGKHVGKRRGALDIPAMIEEEVPNEACTPAALPDATHTGLGRAPAGSRTVKGHPQNPVLGSTVCGGVERGPTPSTWAGWANLGHLVLTHLSLLHGHGLPAGRDLLIDAGQEVL